MSCILSIQQVIECYEWWVNNMVNATAREIAVVYHKKTRTHTDLSSSFFSFGVNSILWLHNSVNKWGLVSSLWHFYSIVPLSLCCVHRVVL